MITLMFQLRQTTFKKNKYKKGFSLIEVLIALTLLALIFTFITGALQFTYRSWLLSNEINRTSPLVTVQDFLIRHISSAKPLRRRLGTDTNLQLAFKGEKNRIEFITEMPERVVSSGLYKLSVYSESEKKNAQLMVHIQPFHPLRSLSEIKGRTGQRILINNIDEVIFEYYGAQSRSTAPAWHFSWKRKDVLPDLVRINIIFPKNAPRHWTPIVVRIEH